MKLVLAVINNDDTMRATSALTEEGFFVTRLSTTGGFLMVGNTTLLIGTDDNKVENIREILRKYCTARKQINPSTASMGRGLYHHGTGEEVIAGGATMFVLSVESFEKFS